MTRSPFSLNRFELEDEHIYFLPKTVFPILENSKSVILRGSRGTGKTTLLKALNWREQISNASLLRALEGNITSRRYLGVYLKLTLAPILPFTRWLSHTPELQAATFSTYLDLLWVEPLLEALAVLAGRRVLAGGTRLESDACSSILLRHKELLAPDAGAKRWSFTSLRDLVGDRRTEMEKLALTNAAFSGADLSKRFPLPHFGQLGRTAAAAAAQFCCESSGPGKEWHIKVCFDESECLDAFQQRVVNTAIRLTDSKLAYVLAFVGSMAEPFDTLIPGISLQRADREVVDLDPNRDATDRLDENFLQLAEGVCRARIHSIAPAAAERFSTTALLGTLDINNLLLTILRSSESGEARAILTLAERLQEVYSDEDDGEERVRSLPVYQAYLVDRLKLHFPTKGDPRDRRKQDSAELRKRMVAAYLCLCAELHKQVRYGYAEMLLQASDRCIRDYLWQMDELYRISAVDIESFCSLAIALDRQDAAMRTAAKNKRAYVELAGIAAPTETLRLIEALGRLTARLQTAIIAQRGLKSSERGVFRLESSSSREEDKGTLKVVTEAAEAGFLKIIQQKPELRFRMHCSLAAYYGFSYRGAYYDTPIRLSDLTSLISQPDEQRLEEEVKRIEAWLGTDASAELPLFQELA